MKQSRASKSPTHTREHPTVTKLFWMGQGKLGRGTQQQHKKATPHSSPRQNEQQTTRVRWNFLHIYDTRGGILSPVCGSPKYDICFFRGPIWTTLKNSGSFCVGQVPGTSLVATRPEKHTCERRICPSLSRPFAAGPASSLFVVVQSVLECDTYTRYNGTS